MDGEVDVFVHQRWVDGWCDERREGGRGKSPARFLPVKPVAAPDFLVVWSQERF